MTRRVVISGYYGFGNVGDELVLAGILRGLRRLDPELRVTVLSADPPGTAREHGVDAVSRTRLPAILGALAGARLLISGGGSLLQDVTGPFNIPYYLGVMELARLRGVPVLMMAQGVGPVRGRLGRRLVRRAVARAAAVTVRDPESAELLAALGAQAASLQVTADAALLLDPAAGAGPEAPAGHPELQGLDGDDGLVVVALRRHPLLDRRAQAAVAAGLDDLARREGFRCVFLPMQPRQDVEVAEQVARLMAASPVLLRRRLAWPELAGLLRRARLVIGMRLHALILAALVGAVPCGIPYDPKVTSFLAQVGVDPVGWVGDLRRGDWVGRIRELDRRRAEVLGRLAPRVAELRRAAALNFREAARLLQVPELSAEQLLRLH